MKKPFSSPKPLFTLLMIASVIAIAAGVYLGIALGSCMPGLSRVLPAAGFVLWGVAWGEFLALCLRLRRGGSAFTATTGNTLAVIGGCMVGLAVVSLVSALIASYLHPDRALAFALIERVLLPGFFLAVAAAAKILRVLLNQAIMIEKEQEGVV